jgi:hypothetical protein
MISTERKAQIQAIQETQGLKTALDEWYVKRLNELNEFCVQYAEKHTEDSENYPLEMLEGQWNEQLNSYLQAYPRRAS